MRTIMPVMRLWSKIRYLVATTGDPVEPQIEGTFGRNQKQDWQSIVPGLLPISFVMLT